MDTLFLDQMLVLLAQGSFTATYKYALLLALIDLCVDGHVSGHHRNMVTTRQVAERLVALYWPHTRVYARGGSAETVLYQSSTRHEGVGRSQAGILRGIAELQARLQADHPRVGRTPAQAQRHDPEGYTRLIDEVEWIAASQPIPRLQLLGGAYKPVLYRIGWTVEQNSGRRIDPGLPVLRQRDLRRDGFDNRLLFLDGVPDQLVALAAVLRPLIQRQWSDQVARLNHLPEHALETFLFGAERIALEPVRAPLLDLQDGRCFYCGVSVRKGDAHVDHFLPWSRVPSDDLGNLVVADSGCNGSKRDFLAGAELVGRWRARPGAGLVDIAREHDWDFEDGRAAQAARVIYGHLQPGVPLWRGRDHFEELSAGELAGILAGLQERPGVG